MLTNPEGEERPAIIPSFQQGTLARYPKGPGPDQEGTIMFADFMLENQWFSAMDSAHDHQFSFNEAISFMAKCDLQEAIDYYWISFLRFPKPSSAAA
ncbi:VOC family protein [Paenibacillus sp. FSL R7-0312]|uniref:VOC family protein n=1 Tax=Paenibacillus sp. FSL R7-0312 TaxID=2921682 RepID=UPI0030FB5FF3